MDSVPDALSASTAVAAAWMLAAGVMVWLWRIEEAHANANLVDVGWTYLVGGLALLFAATGPGWGVRRLLIGAIMGLWSLRLGTHLLRDRLLSHAAEDGRYRHLRAEWGAQASRRFFVFFQAQALAALLFATPAFLAARDPHSGLRPLEIAALVLWVAGLLGESLADRQLAAFKQRPDTRGQVCMAGLWRYSRHPNYFFEWLMWVAYALFAWSAPGGAWALVCPAAMLWLLFKVTGIPATEAQALRSRGDAYRRYQQHTSVFIPWFPS